MAIPNYVNEVARVAAQYPEAWRAAHTDGPRTEEFIRLLAVDLHQIDPNVGLNGKRGNPNDISDDALAIYTPEGSVTDRTGRRMEVIDVIAGAGGPNPQPAWQAVGGPSPGAWVQPEAASKPVPPPPAPVPVLPPELVARLDTIQSALTFAINQIAAWRNDTLQHANQLATVNQKLDETNLRVLDVRKTLDNGLDVKLHADLKGWGSAKGPISGVARG